MQMANSMYCFNERSASRGVASAEGRFGTLPNLRFRRGLLHYVHMTTFPLTTLAQQTGDSVDSWAPVVLLLVIGVGFAVVNIAASLLIGPSRTGPGKEVIYESGMVPIGDTRKRFNVRFYIVAMIFLVFDVEIVFLYPWATIFSSAVSNRAAGGRGFAGMLLVEMGIFVGILLLAYFYAWGKGVFRWD
jgi:NADH-quinone oxidoreductase subunit A